MYRIYAARVADGHSRLNKQRSNRRGYAAVNVYVPGRRETPRDGDSFASILVVISSRPFTPIHDTTPNTSESCRIPSARFSLTWKFTASKIHLRIQTLLICNAFVRAEINCDPRSCFSVLAIDSSALFFFGRLGYFLLFFGVSAAGMHREK